MYPCARTVSTASGEALPERVAQLDPQPGDVHVHRARLQTRRVDAPHVLEQLLARHGPFAVGDQVAEDGRLGLGQLAALAFGPAHLAAVEVDHRPTEASTGASAGRPLRAAQHRLDPGQQFAGRERLDDVIVGPHLQAAHAVVLGAACGEDDDRQRRPRLPQLTQHFQAVQARQQQVEQHQVDAGPVGLVQPAGAVGRLRHLIAGGAQHIDHPPPDRCFVLDDRDARRGRHVMLPLIRRPGGGARQLPQR